MRLSRTDFVPVLAIVTGGVIGASLSFGFLGSGDVPAPDPVVVPAPDPVVVWKHGRTAYRELHARGLPDWLTRKGAGRGGRWWWAAGLGAMHTALPGSYFERLGVPRLGAQTSTH